MPGYAGEADLLDCGCGLFGTGAKGSDSPNVGSETSISKPRIIKAMPKNKVYIE